MNANDQAQKGFKTFVLTLSISLIVFSVIYYLISNNASFEMAQPSQANQPATTAPSQEQSMKESQGNVQEDLAITGGATALEETEQKTAEQPGQNANLQAEQKAPEQPVEKAAGDVAGAATTESVFEQLASGKKTPNIGSVLAGATQSSQSSVPSTGTMSVTVGLASSLLIFAGVMIFMARDPRRFAMLGFEKKATKDLEKR